MYKVAYQLLRTKRQDPIFRKLKFTYRIKTYGTQMFCFIYIKLNIFLIIDESYI